MENNYVKQFPDLLKGKKMMYVHGFGSSGQSGTVRRLRTVFPNATVIAPDLPLHPEEAIALLHRLCQDEQPDMILGTSMGGMYTEQLRGFDRICTNPALCIADTMHDHGMTGTQQYQNPRLDGVQTFYVDKALVKEYRTVSERRFENLDDADRQRVFGLFGDEDTLVDTFDLFHQHYPQAIRFHGEHRMDDRSFMHSVLPVIRWIDDRQEKRERPVVYIGTETLQPTVPMCRHTPARQLGSGSISTCRPGDTPSSPTSGACSTATISLRVPRRATQWPPALSSVATRSRPGTTSSNTSAASEANDLFSRERLLLFWMTYVFVTTWVTNCNPHGY